MRFPEFSGEWKLHATTDYFEFKNGLNPEAKRFGLGTKFISVMDILNNRYITYDKVIASVLPKDDDLKEFGVNYGDILFQRSSETLEDVGRANVYLDDKTALFGGFVIRGKKIGNYNPLFFRYLLSSPNARKSIIVKGAGAQHFNISQDGLSKVLLNVPSIQEQEKISQFINYIDERIDTQSKIIEDLKKLKVAISNRLLNNNTLLDKTASLSKFGELKNGYAFKSSTYVPNGNYNIITIANVCGSREISTDCSNTISSIPKDIQSHQILKSGDILISLTGNVGRVSLNKGSNNLLNQRVGLFVPNDSILSEFLYQTLSFVQFENSMINLAQGAAQMNIGKSDVESYLVRYSDDRGLINEISQILLNYDKKIEIENKYLQSLLSQKAFLLSNMFI